MLVRAVMSSFVLLSQFFYHLATALQPSDASRCLLTRIQPPSLYQRVSNGQESAQEIFSLLCEDDEMPGGGNIVNILCSEEDENTIHLAFDTGDIVTLVWDGEATKVNH